MESRNRSSGAASSSPGVGTRRSTRARRARTTFRHVRRPVRHPSQHRPDDAGRRHHAQRGLFGTLLVTAAAVFALVDPDDAALGPLVFGGAIIGLVLSLVISFSKKIRPPLMFAYAVARALRRRDQPDLQRLYDGIVMQAVLGTLGAFAAMLALYRFGVVKATPKFTKTLMIAGVGYLAFGLINLVVA